MADLDPARDALIVFAKVPTPGAVKTRLTPYLSSEEAADLYEAFLLDALAQYCALDVAVRLYMDEPRDAIPDRFASPVTSVHRQEGEGLGARMARAFLETFAAGFERLVIVGTDHPTLPSAFIEAAFDALAEPLSVSIGPSDDGGYYLLGMNEFYPPLFAEMTYSHPDVFAQTLERIGETGARLTVLPLWYDVDTPDTLERLRQALREDADGLPHTRRALTAFGDRARRARIQR